jgi:hypothetical protein
VSKLTVEIDVADLWDIKALHDWLYLVRECVQEEMPEMGADTEGWIKFLDHLRMAVCDQNPSANDAMNEYAKSKGLLPP